jgi:hypothetical protein
MLEFEMSLLLYLLPLHVLRRWYVDEEAITRARQSRELRWMPTQPQDQPLIWSSAQKELSDPPKRRFPSLVEAVEELWASSF